MRAEVHSFFQNRKKNELQKHSIVPSSDPDLSVFLFRLLEQGQHSDVKFQVHGQTFQAHRCVLSARSEYFTEMFKTKWNGKNLITLKHPLVSVAWLAACPEDSKKQSHLFISI